MVPKIRNADNKNISLISNELKTVSEQCRNLKIDKKEFFGGSMTITSLRRYWRFIFYSNNKLS